MATITAPPTLEPVGTPLNLIPVGLKEAAFDSPTFRATAVHFSDQAEIIERWLQDYVKSTSKLVHEVASLEDLVNNVLAKSLPPPNISEAIVDPDYTLLAMQRYGEGAREFWSHTISGMKKMENTVIEPIRAFINGELRHFKDARKGLDNCQRSYDNLVSRFASQGKTKEPSALREDAFQLHEGRKAYLKASMDFCVLAPQLRASLDKLLVKLFTSQWQEMRKSRDSITSTFVKWQGEMDRVRGWSKEMEVGERTLKRELQLARKQIQETAESLARPSRDLDYYAQSSVLNVGPPGTNLPAGAEGKTIPAEKQGWLFVRTLTGKPTRTIWVRRWYFVRHGIFGWLGQGHRSGGVEESEKIGVLLCNVKPAAQEERRFCFEVKTKDSTILLQAETQNELSGWIESFEAAKRRALEDSSRSDQTQSSQAAFAISPPSAPEFALKIDGPGHGHQGSDELSGLHPDRSSTLPVPGADPMGVLSRGSIDVTSSRRPTGTDRDGESSRDHAARIIQKLDLHRKSNASQNAPNSAGAGQPSPALPASGGGIASLISASHNILPVYSTPATVGQPTPGITARPTLTDLSQLSPPSQARNLPTSTLAPSTLANPPSATNLSKTAVVVSGERGASIGPMDMPGGMMANLWGSNNWGFVNRLEGEEMKGTNQSPPMLTPVADKSMDVMEASTPTSKNPSPSRASSQDTPSRHRKTISLDEDTARYHRPQAIRSEAENFPPNYPIQLRTQEAQFRILFPNVRRSEKVVLVFRGTWSPNDLQEFPGRVYVTQRELYFYSHHLGMVLISGMSLTSIDEVTAAPGKDCDFLFIHMKEDGNNFGYKRVNVKIFLEPLRLLQRRLNFLTQNAISISPLEFEALITALLRMENEAMNRKPSLESWENLSVESPAEDANSRSRQVSQTRGNDTRHGLLVDHSLQDQLQQRSKGGGKFKLPARPVIYEPRGVDRLAASKEFDISPKALFHVLFGDKSAIFQLLYHERWARNMQQSPWEHLDNGKLRRQFNYQIELTDFFGRVRQVRVRDTQTIDILQDHLCYSITDAKTPWHLPFNTRFTLVAKFTITHLAKSKCKLAIHTAIKWHSQPPLLWRLIHARALVDSTTDALDLVDICADQVRRLGAHSRTRKAIAIFGPVGQLATPLTIASLPQSLAPNLHRASIRSLITERAVSLAESFLSAFVLGTLSLFRFAGKLISAHALLLLALLASLALNGFNANIATQAWWVERGAIRYMGRLGVKPDAVMARAVYVRDIAEITAPKINGTLAVQGSCYNAFEKIANEWPFEAGGRWGKARRDVARQRHDLLVGLKVVDAVEKEVLRAGWEEWIVGELGMCDRAGKIVEKKHEEGKGMGEVKGWLEGYCESCKAEGEKMISK
ncbi:MAG: SNF1-interacting protein [Vezdaea aestivalis]|nr:MAG: SNF1-interacting protein [Vezdaea aestivalis]